MHVGTKRIAFLGLLLALAVGANILSSVIEVSTLFFIAAASYLVGVARLETNNTFGIAFWFASILLSFILAPNKIYCLTFALMAAYLLATEIIQDIIQQKQLKKLVTLRPVSKSRISPAVIMWIIRFVVFNIIYVPVLLLAPKLVYAGDLSPDITIGLIAVGQVGLIIYEFAYGSFIVRFWRRLRKGISI